MSSNIVLSDDFALYGKFKCHMGHFTCYAIELAMVSLFLEYMIVTIDRRTNEIVRSRSYKISHMASIMATGVDISKNLQELVETDAKIVYEEYELEQILLGGNDAD